MKLRDVLFTTASVVAPNLVLRYLNSKYMTRVYEGAETYPSSDWVLASSNSSANSEIERAQKILISRSRDLVRNNPYSKKAVDVIVSDTVGSGIVPKISGRNKTQVKKITALWEKIAESNLCDNERQLDFYSLQALAMQTIVESGEVLAIKSIDVEAPSIQLLEPDFIDTSNSLTKNVADGNRVVAGIEVDSNGRRVAYYVYNQHPGDSNTINLTTKKIDAKHIIHCFHKTRPGQMRGVPWAHSVINILKDFADFQYATLIRQKISACLVGAIRTTGTDKGVFGASQLKEKRQRETKMTPGSWRYLDPGEDVVFSNPPNTTGYSEFTIEMIRAVSCGYGITYESISNNYGNVNFSSGRMGHIQMRRNIDRWRWTMLIPQFCDPFFQLFLDWCKARGVDVDGVKVEWVPPAHVMIDPTKEIAAEAEAVKHGFKSKSMVIREQGLNPEAVREEIKAEREADAEAGLAFGDNKKTETTSNKVEDNEELSENDEETETEDTV